MGLDGPRREVKRLPRGRESVEYSSPAASEGRASYIHPDIEVPEDHDSQDRTEQPAVEAAADGEDAETFQALQLPPLTL